MKKPPQNPHYRYFIEIQPRDGAGLPRAFENEARRAAACHFIETVRAWLQEKDLGDKVSTLDVTMFGQVQITCDAAVINFIRNQELADITAIRQGAIYSENLGSRIETR
jgi:hypothetical protein